MPKKTTVLAAAACVLSVAALGVGAAAWFQAWMNQPLDEPPPTAPIEIGDVVLCMGASIGLATGMALTGTPSIALIGDSTFLHAGLASLRNAVTTGAKLLVCILDNSVSGMTGGQKTADEDLAVAVHSDIVHKGIRSQS